MIHVLDLSFFFTSLHASLHLYMCVCICICIGLCTYICTGKPRGRGKIRRVSGGGERWFIIEISFLPRVRGYYPLISYSFSLNGNERAKIIFALCLKSDEVCHAYIARKIWPWGFVKSMERAQAINTIHVFTADAEDCTSGSSF